jgi:hypothetical protein
MSNRLSFVLCLHSGPESLYSVTSSAGSPVAKHREIRYRRLITLKDQLLVVLAAPSLATILTVWRLPAFSFVLL